ncbi:extracellular solute-binding protein [Paenibacillus sp. y28]|uniref:extracellular solute-binding protein n=1 Tax=Paenibacillus sp. y28 TaxID=3129110 RepID=UPI00301835F9
MINRGTLFGKLKKRWIVITAVVVFAFGMLLQFGLQKESVSNYTEENAVISTGGQTDPGDAAKELSLSVSLMPGEFETLQQLVKQAQSKLPGVKIKLDNLTEKEAYEQYKKSAQLREGPDVMLLDNIWVDEFAALGYLLPVDEQYTTEQQAQTLQTVLGQIKWNGYLWGKPFHVEPYGFVYNKDVLTRWKSAQDNDPELASSSLLTAHRASARPAEDKYGVLFDGTDPYAFFSAMWAFGSGYLPPSGKSGAGAVLPGGQTAAAFNAPAQVKLLEAMLFLTDDKKAAKPAPAAKESAASRTIPLASETWNAWDALEQGKALMLIASYSEFKAHSKPGIIFNGLPLAGGEAGGLWLKGKSLVVSSRSEVSKEALLLVQELTSSEALLKLWEEARVLPAYASLYGSPRMKNDADLKEVLPLIDYSKAVMGDPGLQKKLASFKIELDKLWKGEHTVQTFADQSQKLFEGK